MVQAHNHGTRRQEQQGLEKGMRHEVKYRDRVGRCTQRHRHVTQLRQRGVGHHALDVVLNNTQEAHEQRRDRTDHQDEVQSRVT